MDIRSLTGGISMFDKRIYILAGALCLFGLTPTASVLAQDDGDVDEGGERCIDTRRISSTRIVDNQNILFEMRDRTIYHNQLPRKCMGLRSGKTISYRTSLSRLCSNDLITLLDSFGMGMSRGPSCAIGKFRPVSKEEAEAIRQGPDADIEPEPIEPAQPEEPEVSD
jgi:uncharacterized protein DUF6491